MAVKATFVLDDATAATIRRLAERSRKPQSLVVREAVAHYASREEKLTEAERTRWLSTFNELVARVEPRSTARIRKELAEIRATRKAGWSRKAGR